MEIFTVNDALARLDVLNNRPIYLEGLLSFQFEDISLNHHPRAEYRDYKSSSIWIDLNYNILRFDSQVMNRWHGKRVMIEGILQKPDSFFGGSGHMCLWSASIIATEIELFKSRTRLQKQ